MVDIYVINVSGEGNTNEPRALTDYAPEEARAYVPSWSPDGTEIAFSHQDDLSGYHIYKVNSDGSGETRLTNSPAEIRNIDPTWSPDGEQIAYVRYFPDCRDADCIDYDYIFEIRKMNSDGSHPTLVRNVTKHGDSAPDLDWQPLRMAGSVTVADGAAATPRATATSTPTATASPTSTALNETGGPPFTSLLAPVATLVLAVSGIIALALLRRHGASQAFFGRSGMLRASLLKRKATSGGQAGGEAGRGTLHWGPRLLSESRRSERDGVIWRSLTLIYPDT